MIQNPTFLFQSNKNKLKKIHRKENNSQKLPIIKAVSRSQINFQYFQMDSAVAGAIFVDCE